METKHSRTHPASGVTPEAMNKISTQLERVQNQLKSIEQRVTHLEQALAAPVITDVVPFNDVRQVILLSEQVLITGKNFAADPDSNDITFTVTTNGQQVTYPKDGERVIVDREKSNTTQIVATVPDMRADFVGVGQKPVTLTIAVAPSASKVIEVASGG